MLSFSLYVLFKLSKTISPQNCSHLIASHYMYLVHIRSVLLNYIYFTYLGVSRRDEILYDIANFETTNYTLVVTGKAKHKL